MHACGSGTSWAPAVSATIHPIHPHAPDPPLVPSSPSLVSPRPATTLSYSLFPLLPRPTTPGPGYPTLPDFFAAEARATTEPSDPNRPQHEAGQRVTPRASDPTSGEGSVANAGVHACESS